MLNICSISGTVSVGKYLDLSERVCLHIKSKSLLLVSLTLKINAVLFKKYISYLTKNKL